MSITFKVRATGASAMVDYSDSVWSNTLDEIFTKDHLVNQAQKLTISLQEHAGFVPPQRGNLVWLDADTYSPSSELFTGFIAAEPTKTFVFTDPTDGVTPRYKWDLTCFSEEILLDFAAPRVFYTLPPFLNNTVGEICCALVTYLAPSGWFDLSGVQSGPTVPIFKVDPTKSFQETMSALAGQFCMHYWTRRGKMFLALYGDLNIATVSDSDIDVFPYNPDMMTITPDAISVYNDVIGLGQIEATGYVREYFVGDGQTPTFALGLQPYNLLGSDLLLDPFTSGVINTQNWTVTDPSHAMFGGPSLSIRGGQAIGQSTLVFNNDVELGGLLVAQHGTCRFTAASSGIIGGMYNAPGPTGLLQSNCVWGFGLVKSLSSSGQTDISPIVSGAIPSGAMTMTTSAGFDYVLQTIFHCPETDRLVGSFSSINTPVGFGGYAVTGDVYYSMKVLVVSESDPYAIPTAFEVTNGTMPGAPEFLTYGLVNAQDMWVSINFCELSNPVDAIAIVYPSANRNAPSTVTLGLQKQFGVQAAIVAGQETNTPSQLSYFGAGAPNLSDILEVRYRVSGRAQARVTDPTSIADESNRAGDGGVRAGVLTQDSFTSPPRSSEEMGYAVQAFMDDHLTPLFTGTFTLETIKYGDFPNLVTQEPVPGRSLTVNVTSVNPTFVGFVKEVVTKGYVDDPHSGRAILTHDLNYGYITKIQTLANILLRSPFVTVPQATTLEEPAVDFGFVQTQYLANVPYFKWNFAYDDNNYELDFGRTPTPSGQFEVRYTDNLRSWGSGSGLDLITTTTSQVITASRGSGLVTPTWYFAEDTVPGPSTHSRYSSLVRFTVPRIPPPPTSVTWVGLDTSYPQVTINIDQTPSAANMFGVSIRDGGGNEIYSFGNPSLYFSPNDPGLTFTFNLSGQTATSLTYNFLTWNTLGELSNAQEQTLTINVPQPSAATTPGECLDVTSSPWNAKGDGATDDTASIQRALDFAHSNATALVQAMSTTGAAGSPLASAYTTKVCLKSGCVFMINPDFWNTNGNWPNMPLSGLPAAANGAPSYYGILYVRSGVQLQIDGVLRMLPPTGSKSAATTMISCADNFNAGGVNRGVSIQGLGTVDGNYRSIGTAPLSTHQGIGVFLPYSEKSNCTIQGLTIVNMWDSGIYSLGPTGNPSGGAGMGNLLVENVTVSTHSVHSVGTATAYAGIVNWGNGAQIRSCITVREKLSGSATGITVCGTNVIVDKNVVTLQTSGTNGAGIHIGRNDVPGPQPQNVGIAADIIVSNNNVSGSMADGGILFLPPNDNSPTGVNYMRNVQIFGNTCRNVNGQGITNNWSLGPAGITQGVVIRDNSVYDCFDVGVVIANYDGGFLDCIIESNRAIGNHTAGSEKNFSLGGTVDAVPASGTLVGFSVQMLNRFNQMNDSTGKTLALSAFGDNETPSGTVNGVNTHFNLGATPSPAASLSVFQSGVQNYNWTLSSKQITFGTAPASSVVLRCWYRY